MTVEPDQQLPRTHPPPEMTSGLEVCQKVVDSASLFARSQQGDLLGFSKADPPSFLEGSTPILLQHLCHADVQYFGNCFHLQEWWKQMQVLYVSTEDARVKGEKVGGGGGGQTFCQKKLGVS